MSRPRIRVIFTYELEINDLAHYNASTLEEAAETQKQMIEDGTNDIFVIMDIAEEASVEVEPVVESKCDE